MYVLNIWFFLVLGTVAINCGFSANLAENPQVKATEIGNHPNFLDLPETTLSNIGRKDLPETTLSTIGRGASGTVQYVLNAISQSCNKNLTFLKKNLFPMLVYILKTV